MDLYLCNQSLSTIFEVILFIIFLSCEFFSKDCLTFKEMGFCEILVVPCICIILSGIRMTLPQIKVQGGKSKKEKSFYKNCDCPIF